MHRRNRRLSPNLNLSLSLSLNLSLSLRQCRHRKSPRSDAALAR